MVTPQTLDWSQTGVLDIQDGSGNSLNVIHLRSVTYVGQANADFSSDATNPDDISCVAVAITGRPGFINLDIRNITSPSYATTQALINAFKTNIAAMYAGGGGGGGVTSVNGDTGPAVVLDFSTVGGGGIRMVYAGAASPAGGEFGTDSTTVGSVTELRVSYAAAGAPYQVFFRSGGIDTLYILTSYEDNSDIQQTVSFRSSGIPVDDPLNLFFSLPVIPGDPSGATLGAPGRVWYLTFMAYA